MGAPSRKVTQTVTIVEDIAWLGMLRMPRLRLRELMVGNGSHKPM